MSADPVETRQGGEDVALVRREPAPRPPRRHDGGDAAVDLGLRRVPEPQLEAGAQQVLEGGPQLRPAARRDHDVHPVRQPARRQRDHRLLEALVLAAEGVPAVDDEEDVAEHVAAAGAGRELAATAPGPQVGHRLDPGLAEPALPPREQRGHLRHGAPHELGLAAARDRAHVRQPRQPGERAAAEVHRVELHLGRRVGQRGRGDERAQQRRLARLRPAGDHHVPRRPGELGPQHVAALVVGAVDDAHRHRELPVGGEAGRGEAAVRGGGQGRQQRVERGRVGQRRQPHLVRRRALAAQPFDDDVEHRRRPRPARHRRPVRADHRGRPAGRGVTVPLEHGARLHPARGEGARAHLAGHRVGVGGGPLGGAVRRRHVPGLEPGHRRRLDLEVARARHRRAAPPRPGPRARPASPTARTS